MVALLNVYVDADACPVKPEVCKVARRCRLPVTFVSNTRMRIPDPGISTLVVVDGRFDAADDWIVAHAAADDIVVTADIPLAHRCIGKGAAVIGPSGRPFTEENIGQAMAVRELMADLREAGSITGGPPPFQKKDRSRFLHGLDQMIQAIKRKRKQ
jgi:uncharacterized protein YaiI (UPF0178 family)